MRGIERQAEQIAFADGELRQYADTRREASVPPEEAVTELLAGPRIPQGMMDRDAR